jgi:hypothetical protein
MRGQLNRELEALAQRSVFDWNFLRSKDGRLENIVIARMN